MAPNRQSPRSRSSVQDLHKRIQWTSISSTSSTASPDLLQNTTESKEGNQTALTLFKDNEPLTEEVPVLDVMGMHARIANPYPGQTPSAILSRNFLVQQFNWSPSFSGTYIDFPDALLQKPSIQAALASFMYFRAGVKIEIRLNSTQYHCGALMLTWVPCYNGPNFPLYASSANKPITISAATQQGVSLSIPYLHPLTWMRWQTASPNHIARVYLIPLHQLIQTAPDASSNVGVQIYAEFTDPAVAGYLPIAESDEIPRGRHGKQAVSQSRVVTATGEIQNRKDPESKNKNENGVDEKPERLLTIRPILRAIPIIGGIIDPICDGIKLFSKLLDKPTSQETMKPVSLSPCPDFQGGNGIDYSQPLSLYRHAQMPQMPALMGGETTLMSMTQLAAVPMLHYQSRFSTSVSNFNMVAKPLVWTNPEGQPDYLAAVAMAHQYWRGTIKYFIQFFTTPFTSCRFRISVNYDTWISSVKTSGDLVSQIVDVKGDTELEFAVPYLWDTHWRNVYSDDGFPRVVLERISDIIGQSVSSDSVIYCSVWRAGSSDMQFMKLQDVADPTTTERLVFDSIKQKTSRHGKIATSQSGIRDRFKRTFSPVLQGSQSFVESGFVSSEQTGAISDALKRYVPTGTTGSGPFGLYWFNPLNWFNSMFYFYRGSFRYRSFYSAASVFTMATMDGQRPPATIYHTGNGSSPTLPAVWPIQQYEVPWYCALPFYTTQPSVFSDDLSAYAPSVAKEAGAGITARYTSVGDDYVAGYLLPPPAFPTLKDMKDPFQDNVQVYNVSLQEKDTLASASEGTYTRSKSTSGP